MLAMAGSTAVQVPETFRTRPLAAAQPATAWLAGSVVVSLVVEFLFFRTSWFYLDDIRNVAQARQQGLSWSYLTSPIGEHLTPGHRLLDWLVAVLFGGNWAAAVTLELAFCALLLTYLARTLCLLYGARPRNAIAVLLAGTAWPLLGTGQWFAGGALAIPVCTGIAGALYHHLRWRASGRPRDLAFVVVWTLVAVLFSLQGVLIPPILFVAALIAREARPTWRVVVREAAFVIPLGVPALALELYERGQPWATHVALPSVAQGIDLVRVIVVRSLLPAPAGIGMDGAPPDPQREVVMRGIVVGVVVVAAFVAVWCRRRWVAAAVLGACAAVLTAIPIALARLDVTGISMSGSEPRYLLPGVLLSALAVGALLAPQRDRPLRAMPRYMAPIAILAGTAWAVVYIANLSYTYHARRVAINFGQAAHHVALRLEQGLTRTAALHETASIVDGQLPFPLFYASSDQNLRSAYGRFFTSSGIAAPGVPGPGGLLSIAPDGSLTQMAFRPTAAGVRCAADGDCRLPTVPLTSDTVVAVTLVGPAPRHATVHYGLTIPGAPINEHTVSLPAGTRRFVIPASPIAPVPAGSIVARLGLSGSPVATVTVGRLIPR